MATAEISLDTASHEEIQEFVDQAVKDVEADRKGDDTVPTLDKPDSQKLAEENDKPTAEAIATETESGDEDTAEADTGDSEDQADGDAEWLDDDLKAEVAAIGIDEKYLAEFTSREELERALRFIDRSALEAGRKAMAEGDKGETQAQEAEKAGEQGKSASEPKEGAFEINLSEDIWDEEAKTDLVGQLTNMRDHYESRLVALESRFVDAEDMVKQQSFDVAVDAMGHADLFGKTGKESAKEIDRRQALLNDSDAYLDGLRRQGREPGDYNALVNRVAGMVFAKELNKKELKSRTRKMSKQSDGRLGGSATKAHDQPESLMDKMQREYDELDKL